MLLVSRDEYILWARSSGPALRTGAYFKRPGRPPIAIPSVSIAASPGILNGGFAELDGGVWFGEPCEEIALASDHFDYTISPLHLEDAKWRNQLDEEATEDALDLMQRRLGRS